MLLMAGLMLADKTAAVEDRIKEVEAELAARDAELAELRAAPAPEPERIEVPVVPPLVTETLAELAARTEALAQEIEEQAAS
jgi:cell division protein ZapA